MNGYEFLFGLAVLAVIVYVVKRSLDAHLDPDGDSVELDKIIEEIRAERKAVEDARRKHSTTAESPAGVTGKPKG